MYDCWLQAFVNHDIANITVPVLNIDGTEDDLLGGEEASFQSQLTPETRAKSQLAVFDGPSGGALHGQV